MYQSNLPVSSRFFVNRAEELRQLARIVERLETGSPSWLAILGTRKIGKTSLLLEARERARRSEVAFVILDSFECGTLTWEIFRTLALRTLDALFASELGLSLERLARQPSEFRRALQNSRQFSSLPAALRGLLLELPDLSPGPELARDAAQLPEMLAEALSTHVLVAWDEFQELASLSRGRESVDVYPLLRSIWQRHRRVAYVISGSARSMLEELVTSESSPFFQHFDLMDLGPFRRQQAIELLVGGAPSDRPLSEALANRAAEALGGHPFYLQLAGEAITAHLPPYDPATIKDSIQALLFCRTGRLSLYFETRFRSIVGRAGTLSATLQALSSAPRSVTEVATEIGASTGSTVRYLERLKDAVEKRPDGRYSLTDSVFGLWLAWRAPGGTVIPMTVIGDEAEQAVARRLSAMGFDLVYQSRASRGAFDLLAIRGSTQLGVQVKRSALPLRFTRDAWSRMVAEADRLGWRWCVAASAPGPEAEISILAPELARVGREVRLRADAAIENVLAWLE